MLPFCPLFKATLDSRVGAVFLKPKGAHIESSPHSLLQKQAAEGPQCGGLPACSPLQSGLGAGLWVHYPPRSPAEGVDVPVWTAVLVLGAAHMCLHTAAPHFCETGTLPLPQQPQSQNSNEDSLWEGSHLRNHLLFFWTPSH